MAKCPINLEKCDAYCNDRQVYPAMKYYIMEEGMEEREAAKQVEKDTDGQVTRERARNVWKRRNPRVGRMTHPSPLPDNKFRVIYADPPWKYRDEKVAMHEYGPAERHYESLSINQLCELPIRKLTSKNAVLFLWVTSPLLRECFPVIQAWGFKYKTSFVWDKVKPNYGHYNNAKHEFLLICTKGSCTPESKKLHDSVITIPKTKKHSEKPEYFRDLIDKLYPTGNRIELFARKKTKENWEYWGNELLQ